MKWIVFTLGLVLAAGGLTAILQGYDIVQVERGWTLVISGASAFSAGIVTIALGVVVSRLEKLIVLSGAEHHELPRDLAVPARVAVAPFRAALAEAGETPAAPVQTEPAPAVAPVADEAASAAADAGSQQGANGSDLSSEILDGQPALQEVGEASAAAATSPVSTSPGERKKIRPRATFALPPLVPAKSIPAPGPWPAGPASTAAEPDAPAGPEQHFAAQPQIAGDLVVESPPSQDLVAPVHVAEEPAVEAPAPQDFVAPLAVPDQVIQAQAGTEHDWLEQALSGIAPDEAGEKKAGEEAPEPAVEPALAPAAKEEAAGSAIIGRYESNGASYVLFADGSIEATTPSGVYRFASMAELKVFIEGGS